MSNTEYARTETLRVSKEDKHLLFIAVINQIVDMNDDVCKPELEKARFDSLSRYRALLEQLSD